MNFLAHSYLSPSNELIRMGNLFGDFIKGKKLEVHPEIEKGVRLHRRIDVFTDTHEEFKKAYKIISPEFGIYSGILVDMFFDYFLAKHWEDHHNTDLYTYTQELYGSVESNFRFLPNKAKEVFPYMRDYNWLNMYKTVDGLEEILRQMTNRIKRRSELDKSIPILVKNEQELKAIFDRFFNQAKLEFGSSQ